MASSPLYRPQPRSLFLPQRSVRKPSRSAIDPLDPINAGLRGCWPLGNVGGAGSWLTPDISGNNNNGTLTSGPTLAAGGHGGMALKFDGSATFVSVPASPHLATNAITLAIWVNFASLANAYSACFSWVQASNASFHQILVKSTGKIACYVRPSGGTVDYDGTGTHTLSVGNWYLLALSYDQHGGLKGYVNGALDGSAAANGVLGTTNTVVTTFGKDTATASRIVNGRLEMARQWDRPLSPQEHACLFAEPYAGIIETAPRWRVGNLANPAASKRHFRARDRLEFGQAEMTRRTRRYSPLPNVIDDDMIVQMWP